MSRPIDDSGRRVASRPAAIWQVPLLILAGGTAIAGLLFGIATFALPPPWGAAVAWGLAGASLTFTIARVVQTGTVTRRELELIVLALGIFIAPVFVIGGIVILVLGFGGLIIDETTRVFARGVAVVTGKPVVDHAPPAHEADPEDIETS
jgi:hypothetical protein